MSSRWWLNLSSPHVLSASVTEDVSQAASPNPTGLEAIAVLIMLTWSAISDSLFDGLKANEAYEFPMMVKSFQATYWEAAMKGMDKAAEELGVTYTAQGFLCQHMSEELPEQKMYHKLQVLIQQD